LYTTSRLDDTIVYDSLLQDIPEDIPEATPCCPIPQFADEYKACDPQAGAPTPPQPYSLQYVEEAGGTRLRVAQRSRRGQIRQRSRSGVRSAG